MMIRRWDRSRVDVLNFALVEYDDVDDTLLHLSCQHDLLLN